MAEHERRRYPRLHANALVRPVGVLHRTAARQVNDISAGGLRVYSDEEHRAGERLEFELLLPQEQPVTFVGQVVWIVRLAADAPARFDVGVKYLEISDDVLQRVTALLGSNAE